MNQIETRIVCENTMKTNSERNGSEEIQIGVPESETSQ